VEHLPENSISQFHYPLPQDRIAFFPLPERDASLLLVRDSGGRIKKDIFRNIWQHIPSQSTLIFNNSKVIPARLLFPSQNGSVVEIFCLEPVEPDNYHDSMQKKGRCKWECLIGNRKQFEKIRPKQFITSAGKHIILEAKNIHNNGFTNVIELVWDHDDMSFGEMISGAGKVPLPPYIKRDAVTADMERYQTVYSRVEGSVAAPTAGLHFTPSVIQSLKEKEINTLNITLHVGAGTFLPVKTPKISDHTMHSEFFSVTKQFLNDFAKCETPVIPVGTTALRTLESLYWLGVKLCTQGSLSDEFLYLDQWEAYSINNPPAKKKVFEALLEYTDKKGLTEISGKTSLMIIPGYKFRVTDAIVTNFHQPGSTLLFLVAALIGESWKDVYSYAMDNEFRFLSYGDSSLLWKTI